MCHFEVSYRDEKSALQSENFVKSDDAMRLAALVTAEGLLPRVREVLVD
jgi:hypothetical protein